ncbi:MAG: M3 family oligoendopeptidase [Flavobacteriales bacterium]|nr:M3 family oligoendopeptidase [Flavobacteriales bacterium]
MNRPAPQRHFLPAQLEVKSWSDLEPWLDSLDGRKITSSSEFRQWLNDLSETEAFIEEDAAWRYIKMTIDTRDEQLTQSYQWFVSEIQPKISPFNDRFNRMLMAQPFRSEFTGRAFEIYFRQIEKEIALYRENNIPLQSEVAQKAQEYGATIGGMAVEVDGSKLTLPQAAAELQKTDRQHREAVWKATQEVRMSVHQKLDELFTQLIELRTTIASNAGFKNFRDYKFEAMGRFDYTKEDCFDFHKSIAQSIKPLTGAFLRERRAQLGVDTLRPWDLAVDPTGKEPLKPFSTADELLQKSVQVFGMVDSFFGECLSTMNSMGYLDLASKEGKAPGGYNYPLYESGVPFIFMNAVGTQRDMVTMMHEGGHAVHSFLTQDLELTSFKGCPSEVAELASMTMELLTMDYWDVFYPDPETLKRAKKDHLQDILSVLPWIAIVDRFQHWVYEHPHHTLEERKAEWKSIHHEFTEDVVDYSGCEDAVNYMWQKQLHIFEVPFYYIEYGMAQLGAIAIWRNYKNDPKKAVAQYKEALKLGYTRSIPEIYEAAGIRFDFSAGYVSELAAFIQQQLSELDS